MPLEDPQRGVNREACLVHGPRAMWHARFASRRLAARTLALATPSLGARKRELLWLAMAGHLIEADIIRLATGKSTAGRVFTLEGRAASAPRRLRRRRLVPVLEVLPLLARQNVDRRRGAVAGAD